MLPLASNPPDTESPSVPQTTNRSGKSGGELNSNRRIPTRNNIVTSTKATVSAPHHQLGYRRQQIMDITEDSNTNSKNKLTLGSGEETLGSQESLDRRQETHGPSAYSVFYHAANNGQELLRFNSKKNLKSLKQSEALGASPYSAGMPGQPQQLF